MAHDYHEGQPGYSPAQILHDGCGECEARGRNVSLAIASMDKGRFALAWRRAADWNLKVGTVRDVSAAERPLLEALWAIRLRLEPRGFVLPGEHALIDQVCACATDITLYWQQAAAWDMPPVPDLATAYNYTVRDLMAARELLFRAQALLMAVEMVATP